MIIMGDYMEWYEIIKELREERQPKLTQEALAKIFNTTQRKISRLETGEAEPKIEDLKMLCDFYNVSADYILGLTDERRPYPQQKRRK